MKRLFMIFLFFIPLFAPAQKKGDNTIIIQVGDTQGISNKIKNLLFESRYTLENFDPQNQIFATNEKTVGGGLLKLMLRVQDSTVTLYGMTSLAADINVSGITISKSFSPVYCGGGKGSIMRNAWNEMNAIAGKIGDSIEYKKL